MSGQEGRIERGGGKRDNPRAESFEPREIEDFARTIIEHSLKTLRV